MLARKQKLNELAPITLNIPPQPPAYVQTVDAKPSSSLVNYVSQQKLWEAEVVVATLILEAGGEGKVGMEAVNEVIQNRSKRRKQSLYRVVTEPLQFSCFNAGIEKAVERAKKHPKWQEAIDILRSPITNHTLGSDHYHTLKVKPKWGRELLRRGYGTKVIKNHIFYYPKKK